MGPIVNRQSDQLQPIALNNLYTFRFDPPFYINAEQIEDIRVVPLYDYDSQYTAGTDLSAVCLFDAAVNASVFTQSEAQIIKDLNGPLGKNEGLSTDAPFI